MSEQNSIEVFQDLVLRPGSGDLSAIRLSLIAHVTGLWSHAPEAEQTLKLIEMLEDLDDVQNVHANFDIPDEILEKIST